MGRAEPRTCPDFASRRLRRGGVEVDVAAQSQHQTNERAPVSQTKKKRELGNIAQPLFVVKLACCRIVLALAAYFSSWRSPRGNRGVLGFRGPGNPQAF
jgi:hypothetical protein